MENITSKPLVSANRILPEITIKALILGIILSMVLAAANAYIGLLVGMTVSASIPAAAVSMGVLRLFKRSNILENNMVQTAASAGESLVAGIIFTIPALVMMHAWQSYHYGPMLAIALIGGILGVAFTIPLRRALIIEAKLAFPEGVATAEVLKTGGIERQSSVKTNEEDKAAAGSFKRLLIAAGIGALIKLLESGVGIISGSISTVKAWFSGKYLLLANFNLSPALIGVGYIVGLNVAILIFAGGVIGTLIGVPLNWVFNHQAIMTAAGIKSNIGWQHLSSAQWVKLAHESWQNCRRIGVGAMMVGGVWSLVTLCKPVLQGFKASIKAYAHLKSDEGLARTEKDMPLHYILLVVLISIVPLFFIFEHALADYPHKYMIASLMTAMMLVLGFLFSSVAGYMAGLVGSSNNPISGVTIATVITSALILIQVMGNQGVAATLGPIAVIFLAGLICSAAAIAGDNMQDLKAGHILGATPWRQQIFQIIGVIAAAVAIPLVLELLHNAYGIGIKSPINPSSNPLAAPQAALMQALAQGIFSGNIKWNFILIGCGLAVIVIILDSIQQRRGAHFRFPVLAVAVGIYLPLGLSLPIFIGGVISHYVKKRKTNSSKGLLIASGLITGEALMGVVMAAVTVYCFNKGITLPYIAHAHWQDYLGIASIILVMGYLYRSS